MSQPRLLLLLDFDGTITVSDTTWHILLAAMRLNPGLTAADTPFTILDAAQWCNESYMHDLQAWCDTVTDSSGQLNAAATAVSAESNSRISPLPLRVQGRVRNLQSRWPIERRSFLRVRAAALGTPEPDSTEVLPEKRRRANPGPVTRPEDWRVKMREAGAKAIREDRVKIRDQAGLKALLAWADATPGVDWAVVSVSFSREFVLGAMIQAALVPERVLPIEQLGYLRPRVHCNELLADIDERPVNGGGDGSNGGSVHRPLHTAVDKLRAMTQILEAFVAASGADEDESDLTAVYVGDSPTDLACLAASNLGVVIRDEDISTSRDQLRWDILAYVGECPHIARDRGARNGAVATSRRRRTKMCWSSNFREIFDHLEWAMRDGDGDTDTDGGVPVGDN